MNRPSIRIAAVGAMLALAACATTSRTQEPAPMFSAPRTTEHRGDDDLLTAGLGLAGLRAMAPPAFADAEHPTPQELRRRALWSNWRGIADLAPGGGFGELYGSANAVPGREFSAFATVPGAKSAHRVLVQVPDAFDAGKRCVVVTASSGSRGIYGAIAVAGAWGLPKGCAVAYTDKGAGTDYFDLDAGKGVRADGTVAARGEGLAFEPGTPAATGVAFKHAHSQDNPEADWGRHVKQAAQFALQSLDAAFPQAAPFTFDNTRVIAVGISNGGGAVLRAAEQDADWLDAVVAGEPNVYGPGEGGRALYDYTTEAALLMPCALLHLQNLPQPPLTAQSAPLWTQRCVALKEAGLIDGADTAAQARAAYEALKANGWTDDALRAGALSVGFDLWRAVAVTYASAYGRYGFGELPCGNRYSALGADFAPRPATAVERAAWWSDASGIPPGAGVHIVEPNPAAPLTTLRCLRGLWTGDDTDARRVRSGIAQTRAGLPRKGLPVVVIHGTDDGLIPPAFSSMPYVRQAQSAGRDVRYWQVRHAQHFDAFLGLPDYGARYVPLLPYVYAALDRVDAHLDGAVALPGDAVIATTPRGAGQALKAENLALPK
ncbi:3-hydroxybutyrate oligomer hydrolase family protein [Lysobacter sp. LF1]|uniref:3-hydroxybutyrate oligomer hydrolase family protein n=1 Tax=Lysobacter stagni TaxID=3045172 RepID=A0ABT6XHG2_9GAMM|nr:3-hydroxybutyrate oligomer hydrolase family protein [Lysobacter sp. LF1]MDI9239587.1 3-hydroxybutyrate oligomer hydrolase family protein [Lysobacter sp. LF1]